MIHLVRHTRSALSADQDHSGSPRSLGASLSERAVLPDPAAVSGHLANCGVPTSACQPLRFCRPAVKYFTRLNSFTFVTARASLCLRLARFVTSRTQDSIPGEAAPPLNGAGISPAGSTRFSWRAIVQVDVSQQGTDNLSLSSPGLGDQEPTVLDSADVYPFPNQPEEAAVSNPSLDKRHELVPHNRVEGPHNTLPTTRPCQSRSPSLARIIRLKAKRWQSLGDGATKAGYI